MKRHMKHVKVLSNELPVQAQETAWVKFMNLGPTPMTAAQGNWLSSQLNSKLSH